MLIFVLHVKSGQTEIAALQEKDNDNREEATLVSVVRCHKNSEKPRNSQAMKGPGKGQNGSMGLV